MIAGNPNGRGAVLTFTVDVPKVNLGTEPG